MAGKRKRTSDRQSWDPEQMQSAIDAVVEGKMGWLKASKTFNVPQATLRRRAANTNKQIKGVNKGLGRFRITLPLELEKDLVKYIKHFESILFGLSCEDVRSLAYQLAEKNGIKHRFNRKTKLAGWDWLRSFRLRNKDISLRKPEATSAARAQAFNKPQVQKFFVVLQELIKKHNIQSTRIWNIDESGLTTVQKPGKILATKGKKQVGLITSAERGQHITLVACMSSAGNFIPPTLIFPRKNWKNELTDEAPTGTFGIAHESGWMTGEVFLKWMKHFKEFANPSPENKVLLLLDGHASHKNLEVLTYAKQHGIIMLCFPPHCTHRLQPLDVCFFGPLKTYYEQEITKWLKCHPGRTVTQYQIAGLFSTAYGKAATNHNALSGFKSTGIWPLNPDIFPEHAYNAAEVTNIEVNNAHADPTPDPKNLQVEVETPIVSSNVSFVTPYDISPLPSTSSSNVKQRKRKSQGTQELTNSPYIEELQAKEIEKRAVETRKAAKIAKRNIFQTTEIEDDEPFQSEEDDDDTPCLYCNELYSRSKSGAQWIQCVACQKWAHSDCADVSKYKKQYMCDICKP